MNLHLAMYDFIIGKNLDFQSLAYWFPSVRNVDFH